MPLFFLLSGFCLTLGYGKKNYKTPKCCAPCKSNDDDPKNDGKEAFNYSEFFFGRMTRILPVYYFCYFFALPLIPLGHSYYPGNAYDLTIGGSILSFFLVQAWVIVLHMGANGPSWTVSTLTFFYLLFPGQVFPFQYFNRACLSHRSYVFPRKFRIYFFWVEMIQFMLKLHEMTLKVNISA